MRSPKSLCSVVMMMTLIGSSLQAQTRSPELAKQCVAALAEQHLNAFATRQTIDADRFVAVLVYPDVQLLVVSARVADPARLQYLIDTKRYADAYAELQQLARPDSKVFVQDLKADGLHLRADASVDVLYEQIVHQTIFDGQPSKHKLTEKQYEEKLMATDATYSQMLTDLLGGLRKNAGLD